MYKIIYSDTIYLQYAACCFYLYISGVTVCVCKIIWLNKCTYEHKISSSKCCEVSTYTNILCISRGINLQHTWVTYIMNYAFYTYVSKHLTIKNTVVNKKYSLALWHIYILLKNRILCEIWLVIKISVHHRQLIKFAKRGNMDVIQCHTSKIALHLLKRVALSRLLRSY